MRKVKLGELKVGDIFQLERFGNNIYEVKTIKRWHPNRDWLTYSCYCFFGQARGRPHFFPDYYEVWKIER